MKITVFGATGGIGKWIVKLALKKDYEVVAYLRNPSKMDIEDKNLTVIKGDITDYESIKRAVHGSDAVLNALGLPMGLFTKEFPAIEANRHIIKVMESEGVRRYITWATPSVHDESDAKSYITVLPGLIAGIVFRAGKKAIIEIATDIKNSHLDWTIVRFMAPKDTPYTGKVNVSFGKEKLSFNIARADIAGFMLEQLTTPAYIRKMPIIGS